MTHTELMSGLALLISLMSFGFSIYFNVRDRANLITKSRIMHDWDGGPAKMEISIVNKGRRPIVLRLWAGTDGTDRWVGTLIDKHSEGRRLAEHERFAETLSIEDLEGDTTPDESIEFTDLWFEDTLGRRYTVKGAREHVAKLRLDNASRILPVNV